MCLAVVMVRAAKNLRIVQAIGGIGIQNQQRRQRWDASYICVFAESMEAFAPVVAKLAGR